MNRSKWIALAAVLIVFAGAAWYFASPAYTLSRMKAAAESNDGDAMAAYIDFPALREDLKADLLAQMMTEMQKDTSPFAGFAMAIGPAMVNSMVDGFVTPAGMKAMFASKGIQATETKQPVAKETFKIEDEPVIIRRGMSEFVVTSKKAPASGMVFKRDGLGWKLSGVDLPPSKP